MVDRAEVSEFNNCFFIHRNLDCFRFKGEFSANYYVAAVRLEARCANITIVLAGGCEGEYKHGTQGRQSR